MPRRGTRCEACKGWPEEGLKYIRSTFTVFRLQFPSSPRWNDEVDITEESKNGHDEDQKSLDGVIKARHHHETPYDTVNWTRTGSGKRFRSAMWDFPRACRWTSFSCWKIDAVRTFADSRTHSLQWTEGRMEVRQCVVADSSQARSFFFYELKFYFYIWRMRVC